MGAGSDFFICHAELSVHPCGWCLNFHHPAAFACCLLILLCCISLSCWTFVFRSVLSPFCWLGGCVQAAGPRRLCHEDAVVDEEWSEALELARLSSKMSLWVSCRFFLQSQLTACPELVSDPFLLALTLTAVGFCPYLLRHKGLVILRNLSTVTQGELDLVPVTPLTNHAFFRPEKVPVGFSPCPSTTLCQKCPSPHSISYSRAHWCWCPMLFLLGRVAGRQPGKLFLWLFVLFYF